MSASDFNSNVPKLYGAVQISRAHARKEKWDWKDQCIFSVAAASPNHNKFMNDAACILEDTIIWARKRGIKTIVILCEDYMQVSFQSGPIQFYYLVKWPTTIPVKFFCQQFLATIESDSCAHNSPIYDECQHKSA